MSKIRFFSSIILLVLFVSACQEKGERKAPPIEPDQVQEIETLTTSGALSKSLRSAEDTTALGNEASSDFTNIQNFYKGRNFQPVWTNRNLREALYRNIAAAGDEGLNPDDYNSNYLRESLASLPELGENERNRLELELTRAFFKFSEDLNSGKLEPEKIYSIWDVEENEINLPEFLEKAAGENDIQTALDTLKPTHPVYLGLKKSLKEYEKLKDAEEEITRIKTDGDNIEPGDKDVRIPSVRKRLQELELYSQSQTDSSSYLYDEKLETAVEKFQELNGIEIDGIIGKGTIKSLNKSHEDRYNQILVNLERWRWFPRDLGDHYIIVNIDNFQLHVIKNGDTLARHRTMVGTEARKTPVFSDKVEHIVYNPTWTIPPTIKNYDVIPAASRDPSYLENKNMTVFNKKGERLDPFEIDWSSAEVRSYTYRQEAGSTNPLGKVKIIYPNPYLIYLHDTPSQSLFDRSTRAQSSGCVRVQGILDLAAYLLNDQEKYDAETITDIIDSGKTTTIKVTQDVKVHHFYWTAWRENDSTHFSSDIYNQDQEILNLLTAGD